MERIHLSTKSTAILELNPHRLSKTTGNGPNAEVTAMLTEIGKVLHWTKKIRHSMEMNSLSVAEVIC